jgi:hypothetical protein
MSTADFYFTFLVLDGNFYNEFWILVKSDRFFRILLDVNLIIFIFLGLWDWPGATWKIQEDMKSLASQP